MDPGCMIQGDVGVMIGLHADRDRFLADRSLCLGIFCDTRILGRGLQKRCNPVKSYDDRRLKT
jgi:hypothetical protein